MRPKSLHKPQPTAATAAALAAYAFGLPGYAALKIVQPAFIAKDDDVRRQNLRVGLMWPGGLVSHFRQYLHLHRTEAKLVVLL